VYKTMAFPPRLAAQAVLLITRLSQVEYIEVIKDNEIRDYLSNWAFGKAKKRDWTAEKELIVFNSISALPKD